MNCRTTALPLRRRCTHLRRECAQVTADDERCRIAWAEFNHSTRRALLRSDDVGEMRRRRAGCDSTIDSAASRDQVAQCENRMGKPSKECGIWRLERLERRHSDLNTGSRREL